MNDTTSVCFCHQQLSYLCPPDWLTQVSGDSKFSKLVVFLRKQLKTESVFVYLREAFTPSLDDDIATLTQAYGIDGKLHINYALTPAWG